MRSTSPTPEGHLQLLQRAKPISNAVQLLQQAKPISFRKFAHLMQPLPRLSLNAAGEMVLPKALQESLQLHAGMPLLVSVEDNRLCLQPMNSAYLANLRGSLKAEAPELTPALLHGEKEAEQTLEEAKLKRFRLHRR